ncbi:MAG: OFA family MFS transporter [Candidatus Marinimicrobia bacterium]|nr:OFA family MFS transporter [Candidatus Neomarinimicrobiota bacterium]
MNTNSKVMNRWLVVIGAIIIQLCLGAIYAWSVFTPQLKEAGWTAAQTQAVFAAGLAFFAIVMVIAGRLMPKIGPRVLAMAGGVVLGIGYLLAGLFGGTNFWAIFIFIGVIGGSGIGLAYVVPIAVGMRWFPDKKGLITGLAVAGFGFGAMLWVKLAGTWGNLIADLGLNATFTIYGIVFFISVVIGGIWMVFPPEGWKPEGWTPPAPAQGSAASGTSDFTSGEMLKTPQFYMILITFAFGASAGLMSIGLMKLFPIQALTAAGIANASAVAGTAMAVFFSLANGIGRIAWGAMSDKLGRKTSIVIMMGTQGIIVILFQWMAGTPALLYLGATLIGFNFGGNFALFPTMTADTFGTKFIGQNYGWVFLAYGIGGIFGPILGGRLGDMGNFPLAFTICGVLCLLAAILIYLVKPPQIKTA